MPILRFNKALSITRNLKVFLNLQSGVTRGALPDAERYKIIKEQRKKIKEQAKNLRYARQHIRRREEELRSKDHQIFQLKNELRAVQEQVENATNGRPTPQVAAESETGALPDFVIIGAQKCGTTFLYDLLTQHPYVERALEKELRYFSKHFERGIEWYRSQFPPPRSKDGRKTITGEATPEYLFRRSVPERMAEVVPHARLIVLLRNPVDRAYSDYHYAVRTVRENRRFEEAIEAEKEWLLGKGDEAPEYEARASVERPRSEYLRRGIYVDQLLRWSEVFSEEQMLVLKSEGFYERTLETLKLIQNFLHLPDWQPEPSMLSKPQNRYPQNPQMNPVTRQWLEDFFEPHNQRLYEYLGVDFGWGR